MALEQYQRRSKLSPGFSVTIENLGNAHQQPESAAASYPPGASAEIYLMNGSPALQGTVLGITRGITDQDNKDGPELLSSVNPAFTWVRLAQRVPVRIRLTHVPPGVLISAGMTCTVVITEGATPEPGIALSLLTIRNRLARSGG